MKTKRSEVTEQNFKVLDGLSELFKSLNEHCAIIGRDNARIVVDMNKSSFFTHEEFFEIHRKSVLVASNGSMNIFSDIQMDGETNILLLNINPSIMGNDEIFSKFLAFNEVWALVESIPTLSKEQSEYFDSLHEVLIENLFGLTAKHRKDIREALFSGGDNIN